MTSKKSKKGRLLIIAGAVLLLAALSLVLWNNYRQQASNVEMNAILSSLREKMPQIDASTENDNDFSNDFIPEDFGDNSFGSQNGESSEEVEIDETYIEVGQKRYLGILQIPSLNLELPVLADYSYEELYNSPCRYSGSVATSDIIIGAHNYRYFFGPIDNLNSGDKLIFTSADGTVYTYSVVQSELIDGDDANSLRANSDDWDMSLFTCTWTGTSRLVVRAQIDE